MPKAAPKSPAKSKPAKPSAASVSVNITQPPAPTPPPPPPPPPAPPVEEPVDDLAALLSELGAHQGTPLAVRVHRNTATGPDVGQMGSEGIDMPTLARALGSGRWYIRIVNASNQRNISGRAIDIDDLWGKGDPALLRRLIGATEPTNEPAPTAPLPPPAPPVPAIDLQAILLAALQRPAPAPESGPSGEKLMEFYLKGIDFGKASAPAPATTADPFALFDKVMGIAKRLNPPASEGATGWGKLAEVAATHAPAVIDLVKQATAKPDAAGSAQAQAPATSPTPAQAPALAGQAAPAAPAGPILLPPAVAAEIGQKIAQAFAVGARPGDIADNIAELAESFKMGDAILSATPGQLSAEICAACPSLAPCRLAIDAIEDMLRASFEDDDAADAAGSDTTQEKKS